MSQDSEAMSYLKQDNISEVISEALAQVYINKPKFPVNYMGKWLLNYCNTQIKLKELQQQLQLREQQKKDRALASQRASQRTKQKDQELEKLRNSEEIFKSKIKDHVYHEELLQSQFPNDMQERYGLSGVYIGKYDTPFKVPDLEEQEPSKEARALAHYDNQATTKKLTYIGTSTNHEYLRGEELPSGSVTYSLFAQAEDLLGEEEDLGEGEGDKQQDTDQKKGNYIYIPHVIKQKKLHYFKLPKLGCYLAVPLTYQCCLTNLSFGEALADRLRYTQELEDQNKQKQDEQEDVEAQVADLDAEDEEDQKTIAQLRADFAAKEWPELQLQPYKSEEQQFIFCCDTLGEDTALTQENLEKIEWQIKHFSQCWTEREKGELERTLDVHMAYQEKVKEIGVQGYNEKFQELENSNLETKDAELNQQDHLSEDDIAFEQESCKMETAREVLLSEDMKEHFLVLKDYRLVLYDGILQALLYFLGYQKQEINVPNQNLLDWKKCKTLLNDDDFYLRIAAYNHRGPKPKSVKYYAYINRLKEKINDELQEGAKQDEIDKYNIGFARIYLWFKQVLEVRVRDIERRRQKKDRKRQYRVVKIEDHKQWKVDYQEEVERKKQDWIYERDRLKAEAEEEKKGEGEDEEDEEGEDDDDVEPIEEEENEDSNEENDEENVEEKGEEVVEEGPQFNEKDAMIGWLDENKEPVIPPPVVNDQDKDYEIQVEGQQDEEEEDVQNDDDGEDDDE